MASWKILLKNSCICIAAIILRGELSKAREDGLLYWKEG